MTQIVPLVAAIAFVAFALAVAMGVRLPRSQAWTLPAALAVGFLSFSMAPVLREGPLGFWLEHTRNLWGVQIWLDLLLAASISWTLIVPRARRVGIRPLPWLVAVVCTGSVGLLAMLAYVLRVERRHQPG